MRGYEVVVWKWSGVRRIGRRCFAYRCRDREFEKAKGIIITVQAYFHFALSSVVRAHGLGEVSETWKRNLRFFVLTLCTYHTPKL